MKRVDFMDAKNRIEELRKILEDAGKAYYVYDKPLMEDYEYDKLMQELIDLENKNPDYKSNTSPSVRIGGEVLSKFEKVTHDVPMMSLADAFSEEELTDFLDKIKKVSPNATFLCELKIDGLSVAIKYKDGKMIQAATRGNGTIGENITHNAKTIKSIPLTIKDKREVEVRGEIFMPKKSFIELNKERLENEEELFANCRNAAAGSIRQLDSKITAKRNLDVFLYYLMDTDIDTQEHALIKMKELGFKVNPKYRLCKSVVEVIKYIKEMGASRNDLEYDIDGIVIKVNEMEFHEEIGYTAKYPKWAIAYKYPPEEVKTKLISITFQVGRTGVITPVANFKPVSVQGSMVSKATLHNAEYVSLKDIHINDFVIIRKAGDVIPEVVRPVVELRDEETIPFKMIDVCPSCQSKLSKKDEEVDYYCLNPNCNEKIINGLIHFASKPAYNIDSLGDKLIAQLYNEGYIKTIADIFKLKNHKTELIELDRLGEKSVNNLLNAIEESKKNNLDSLIFGLGIRHVGSKIAKLLANKFSDIDGIMNATYENIIETNDIGDAIAKEVVSYFSIKENQDMIDELKTMGLNMSFGKKAVKESFFTNKRVVLTGTLESMGRSEAKNIIEEGGGSLGDAISKNVDFLILGENPGSKYDKAKALGIYIMNEEEFLIKAGIKK